METRSASLVSIIPNTTWVRALIESEFLVMNMGKYNKGSNLLIIVGIVGLVVAIIVGIVIWRAILR